MKDLIYLAGLCTNTLASMVTRPNQFPQRSWSSEYARRLASNLLEASVTEPDQWLRRKQELLALKGPALLQVRVEKEMIDGVACIRVRPKKMRNPDTKILYLHGGGYVIGSASSYLYTGARVALALNAEVLLVDYPLVPEAAVSDALDSIVRVYRVVMEMEPTKKLVLMGDSAGGGLCLALTRSLIDSSELHSNTVCILWSPWVDPSQPSLLDMTAEEGDLLGAQILEKWRDAIVRAGDIESIVCFSGKTWEGFPATCIQAAGAEMFLPQVNALAADMKRDGVDVSYEVFPGQFHVFQTLAPLVREADEALESLARFVGRY
ncbi:MAG: hypothetical protein C9356_08170 [Oleiphilus sp.]|nr:MAG: hypothetical protein C9356_08170 [Oleiphilus sp.]